MKTTQTTKDHLGKSFQVVFLFRLCNKLKTFRLMKTFKDLSLGQEAVMVTNKMIAQKVVLCNNHTNKFNATLHVLTFAVDDESCYSIAIDDEVMEHGKYAPYGKPWIVVDDDEIRNVLEEANDNLEKALATNKEILSQVAK